MALTKDVHRRAIHEAVGEMVTSWAVAEALIDRMIIHLHDTNTAFRQISPDIPRSLNRKLNLLHKAAKWITLDDHGSSEVRSYVARMQTLKVDRHRLVHGVALDTLGPGGEAIIVSRDQTEPRPERDTARPYSVSDIEKVTEETVHTVGLIAVHAVVATGFIPRKQFEETLRKISGELI